jgi:hypothetical protein
VLCVLTKTAIGFAARPRDDAGVPWQPQHVRKAAKRDSPGGAQWEVVVGRTQSLLWYFGAYIDRAQAAQIAHRAALVVHGEYAALNLPDQITADERRALSAIKDVAAYAEMCRKCAPCAQRRFCEHIGVTPSPTPGKVCAHITVCRGKCHLGSFDGIEDAAAAYDEAAILADIYAPKLTGGARQLNFPAESKVGSVARLRLR